MRPLQITHIISETKDAKTFVLQPMDNAELNYKAGQFLTLVFDTRFGEKRRSYSITSSPDLNEPLSITVKRVENGEFSRLLLGHAKEGDVLNMSDISGMFHLPGDINSVEQFFFFAAGSGITPCFSIIKTLLVTTQKQVVLIYSNRQKEETIFYDQLTALQKKYPEKFKIRFLFSINPDVYNRRLSNWLLQGLLKEFLITEKKNALFFLCGPFDYMQMVNISLLSEGIPQSNIKKENFNALPRIFKPVPPDIQAHMVTVILKNSIHTLSVKYPTTILAAAKAANIPIPYSCEAGRCGSCTATCVKGKIWMAYNEVLMDDELEKGRMLCCQAYPIEGDAEIIVSF